ncbi:MAG TPA: hypothetical protein VID73_08740, partial [Ktedonobacterales bacterium]
RITGSVIRGPAIIGERSQITNAFIGPFSSIYHDVTIDSSEVEHCIVLENARISRAGRRIESSLIGRFAEVESAQRKPKALHLMLGDHSKVGLPLD